MNFINTDSAGCMSESVNAQCENEVEAFLPIVYSACSTFHIVRAAAVSVQAIPNQKKKKKKRKRM